MHRCRRKGSRGLRLRTSERPRTRRAGFLAGVAVGAALATAAAAVSARAEEGGASPFAKLAIFARALAHVEAVHVEAPDTDALVHGAIRGMVSTLDPHSAYLDPEEARIFSADTEGRFGGIGVRIGVEDGWMIVLSTFEGGPAARAGVEPGDRFLRIGDRDARDMRLEDAVRLMRGEPGTEVAVRLRRPSSGEALDLVLRREVVHVDAVRARLLPDRVVYVAIEGFQATTAGELRRALDQAVAAAGPAGVRGVLLDLRRNGGGLVEQAVLVADEFLERGLVVSTRGRGGRLLGESHARRAGTRPDWPMVVLVDPYTASAAEIVAGALRDHGRALLVGQRTFGKGSVQTLVELPDGSSLKLTIARYYTPSGASIQARGIEPDLVVPQLPPDQARAATRDDGFREERIEGHLPATRADATGPAADRPPRRSLRLPENVPAIPDTPFTEDYQARIGHQTLRAVIATAR